MKQLPTKNVTSKEGNKNYQERYFKEEGKNAFTIYLQNLIREYIVRENYPFQLP